MNYASKTKNKTKTKKNTPHKYTKPTLLNRSRKNMNSGYSIHPEKNIIIPKWAKIVEYRTMTSLKKDKATNGDEKCQIEWMFEEVNEFYEAIYLEDIEEIRDEAIGLIRTFQQFQDSKRVVSLWKKVRSDVLEVFPTRRIFVEAFVKWHNKKLQKNQAKGVTPEELIHISKMKW